MKCSQVQSVLSEYLDGELSIVQAAGVREHLDCCVCCEARWRMLRQTVRLVAHMGQEKCPVDLRTPVAMAVQHRYAGRRSRFPFVPFAVISGAGTALAALVVGLSMLRPDIAVGRLEATIPVEQPAVVAEAYRRQLAARFFERRSQDLVAKARDFAAGVSVPPSFAAAVEVALAKSPHLSWDEAISGMATKYFEDCQR